MATTSDWNPPSRARLALWTALFVALHMYDAVSTVYVLERGGTELNPVAESWYMLGKIWFVAIKIFVAVSLGAVLAVLTRAAPDKRRRFFWRVLCFGIALQSAIAIWHVWIRLANPLL